MSEQEPKKSREAKKPAKPDGKTPTSRELDESELDGIAGGQAEQQQKAGMSAEEERKTVE